MRVSVESLEYGGLRWGQSYWHSMNASWPFATWRLTSEALDVQVQAWPFANEQFHFSKPQLRSFRRYRGFLSFGVQIDHSRPDYPPFIVFWSFSTLRMLADAQASGWAMSN